MTDWITKKDENGNVRHIPIQDKKLYDAYIKSRERSEKLKKWVFMKAERKMIASKLEWFMRNKAQRDAFFDAEQLLQNVNTDDELETLLLKKAGELEEQFDNEYDNLKKSTAEIFENHNLTEEDIKNALTFTYYEYYIERYLYTLAEAYVIKHNLPYSTLKEFNFNMISKTKSRESRNASEKFFNPYEYPFSF